jgi:hypothetical protein
MRYEVHTTCTAVIHETWYVDAPEEADEYSILDAFDDPESRLEFVSEATADERDREVTKFFPAEEQ